MKLPYPWRTVVIMIFVDAAMLLLSLIAAYYFRSLGGGLLKQGVLVLSGHWQVICGIIAIHFWFLHETGLYRPSRHIRRIKEIFLVAKAVTYALILLLVLTFFDRDFSCTRPYLVFIWVFSGVFISAGRYVFIQWGYWRREQGKDLIKVLIIGLNLNTRSLVEWAKHNPHYGQIPVGILAQKTEDVGKMFGGIPVLGRTEQWEFFIQKLQPNQVIFVDEGCAVEQITDIVAACEDASIDFKMGADIHSFIASNVNVEYVSNISLLGFRSLPLDHSWNRFLKRTFDLVVGGFIALFFLPIGLVIALLIKLEDGGDVFYFQERIGRDGKGFRLIKFRTMKVDAEKEVGPVWAKPDDARRTRNGRFLRRWNLDEFPQLLNVFSGEMSLVGPRPERPHFVNKFSENVPRYMARHKVKSGITGWAQVHGLRGDTSIKERIKYDFYYMENWSLLLDVEIMVMTLLAFKNAY